MRPLLIVCLLSTVLLSHETFATQQPVTNITSGTGTTGLNLKQYNDAYINPRLTNIASNDTDLYTNKADKSSFSSSSAFAAAWGWEPGVSNYNDLTNKPTIPTTLAALTEDSAHRVVTDSEKTTWNTAASNAIPVGTSGQVVTYNSSNLPTATTVPSLTGAEVGGVFSGAGEYLKKDGTSGTPPTSSTFAGLTDLPSGVNLTTLGYLSGTSSNIQTQINSISAGGFVPNYVTTDPTTASAAGLYINTTSGHMFVVGAPGMLDIAGTWTANIPIDTWTIDDDFSTNTVANYTKIEGSGTLSILDGVAKSSDGAIFQHNTSLGSSSQEVQAKLFGPDHPSSVVVRSNGTTGHYCYPTSIYMQCTAFGGTGTDSYFYYTGGKTWEDSRYHLTKVAVNSSNLYSVYVDWNDDGDFSDADEGAIINTNASFSGNYVGFSFYYPESTTYVDNFKARVLQ